MITDMLHDAEIKKLLDDARDGMTPYVCPVCGNVDYLAGSRDDIHCEVCGSNFPMLSIAESDLMHYDFDTALPTTILGKPDTEWEAIDLSKIKNKIRQAEGNYETGKVVYLSVCPDCGGYHWTKQRSKRIFFCGQCDNTRVIVDAFVL